MFIVLSNVNNFAGAAAFSARTQPQYCHGSRTCWQVGNSLILDPFLVLHVLFLLLSSCQAKASRGARQTVFTVAECPASTCQVQWLDRRRPAIACHPRLDGKWQWGDVSRHVRSLLGWRPSLISWRPWMNPLSSSKCSGVHQLFGSISFTSHRHSWLDKLSFPSFCQKQCLGYLSLLRWQRWDMQHPKVHLTRGSHCWWHGTCWTIYCMSSYAKAIHMSTQIQVPPLRPGCCCNLVEMSSAKACIKNW